MGQLTCCDYSFLDPNVFHGTLNEADSIFLPTRETHMHFKHILAVAAIALQVKFPTSCCT